MPLDWPDLRSLEVLVAIADNGGIGAAARRLGIAQPNASRMVAALENRLGAALVTRHPRGATMTDEGREVVDHARRLLESAREFNAATGGLASGEAALHVAASMTVAAHLMPGWLGELRRRRPALEVTMRVRNSERVFDEVADGACRIGFVETPMSRRGLHGRIVADDRLRVLVSPAHPWGRRTDPVGAAELASTPLIVRESGSGTRVTLDRALGAHGPATVAVELGSNEAVAASIIAGNEPGVLSELAVADRVGRGELVAVPVGDDIDLRRHIRAVWRGAPPHAGAAELIAIALG